MATQSMRPVRTLIIFGAVLALAYVLIAANNAWKPQLGLDLRGGLRLTGTAQGLPGADGKPVSVTSDALNTARNIIDTRVNGSGVSAAQVVTDGGDKIEVSIPGAGTSQKDLATEVFKPAQLRFRYVACPGASGCSALSGTLGAQRAPFGQAPVKPTPSATPSSKPSSSASPSGAGTPSPLSPATGTNDPTKVISVKDAAADMVNPSSAPAAIQSLYTMTSCAANANGTIGRSVGTDLPGNWLVSCGADGQKYLLTPAMIEGTDITQAAAQIASSGIGWSVTLTFDSRGSGVFADATGTIAGTNQQFAVVVDGVVQSAPTASQRISGQAEITGGSSGMAQSEAQGLANNLKYGALPLEFPPDGQSTEYIGPSLAGQQLSTGLWAGAIGLLLVMIFALFYYRGLGLVVIGSLVAAGAATYSLVALLSKSAGVNLDLPGIAGLIVAVGITADSFIVYFERIRDEMRDGKSMRVAVDAAWARARRTCLAADSVSLLAAITLYFFASNDVKGFAFMLGLSTIIDLVVFFYFTHPLVKLLSQRRFFNRGHRLSGLDARTLGVDSIVVGGKA